MRVFRTLRSLVAYSVGDMFVYYPPRLYLLSWFPRIFAQIAFFAIVATVAGGPAFLHDALIGNSFYILISTLMSGVAISLTWERRAGTLPLMIASPTSPLLIFVGRNVGMALHGLISGLVSIYIVAPILGVHLDLGQACTLLLFIACIMLSGYGVGLLLGTLALYARGYHNLISNLISFSMLAFCGVNYPVAALPPVLQQVAAFLPLTHGLAAVRLFLRAGLSLQIPLLLLQELGLGLLYALAASLLLGRLLTQARRAGTLEYH